MSYYSSNNLRVRILFVKVIYVYMRVFLGLGHLTFSEGSDASDGRVQKGPSTKITHIGWNEQMNRF